jgi:D-alanyl-D-alanine carboxypeptidase/D-alanyl-D-alanine-endopeptidase (penicillin-binding protein 4)
VRSQGRWFALVASVVALGVGTAPARASDAQDTPLPPAIASIMAKPQYAHAAWGLLDLNPAGTPVLSRRADEMFIPGSTTKLFSTSAAWSVIGPDHRFTTPVYALGRREGGTLHGDLVLVGAGDLSLGGRAKPGGGLDYTNTDHTDAPIPGAQLTPENPLAGIKHLARQVRRSGIRRVHDVAIDNRLFTADFNTPPEPTPVMINDNVIDVVARPTSPGHAATVGYRPKAPTLSVDANVRTVSGTPSPAALSTVTVTGQAPGHLEVTGTVADGSPRLLQIAPIAHPAAFARTVFIKALRRAGVRVNASRRRANPAAELPAARAYRGSPRVAEYVSPPYADYAKLIMKVSHNLGANLNLCLLAVHAGETDCSAGFGPMNAFLQQAGVDLSQVELADGRGGDPIDRFTPMAVGQLLRYWIGQPDFGAFRATLPILGVDGSLAHDGVHTPARGKVFAKTGTALGGDPLNNRVALQAKSLAGYYQGAHGGWHVFDVVVNNAGTAPDFRGFFHAARDLGDISAALWQQSNP